MESIVYRRYETSHSWYSPRAYSYYTGWVRVTLGRTTGFIRCARCSAQVHYTSVEQGTILRRKNARWLAISVNLFARNVGGPPPTSDYKNFFRLVFLVENFIALDSTRIMKFIICKSKEFLHPAIPPCLLLLIQTFFSFSFFFKT